MLNEKEIKERVLETLKEEVKLLKTEGLTVFEKNITISSIIIGVSCVLRSVECDIAVEDEILNEVVKTLAEEILKDKTLVNRIIKTWEESE
jgi:hypothetical protein